MFLWSYDQKVNNINNVYLYIFVIDNYAQIIIIKITVNIEFMGSEEYYLS